MIDKIYGRYFQKSRSFLYPALGIKRGRILPSDTYISIKGLIGAEDMKLICLFKDVESESFKQFEDQMLISNPLFEEKKITSKGNVYIFNLEIYKNDYFYFLMGKYSQFSTILKRAIRLYYGEKTAEYKYIETYLYPEKFFELYAKLLDVDVETLKELGELCDTFDQEKETLEISTEDLEMLTKIQ